MSAQVVRGVVHATSAITPTQSVPLRDALQQFAAGGAFAAGSPPAVASTRVEGVDVAMSQESDTFGSLDPIADAVGSQLAEAQSQELPFEIETSTSQGEGQSQITENSEPAASAEGEALSGNFPAVNVVPDKDGQKAAANGAKGGQAPPKAADDKSPQKKTSGVAAAEVDAADVLLSLSMTAARRAGAPVAVTGAPLAVAAAAAAAAKKPVAPKPAPVPRAKKQAVAPATAAVESPKAVKTATPADKDKDQTPSKGGGESSSPAPPPPLALPWEVPEAPPPPPAAAPIAVELNTAVTVGLGEHGGIKGGTKRPALPIKAEFVNPEDIGYVHKFRWEEQPEPAKKKPKASSWVLPTKKSEAREKLQTGGVKAGSAPVKRKSAGSFSSVLGSPGQKQWTKSAAPYVPVLDEAADPDIEREEQALKKQYEQELQHDVQFGHLQIQTSNIKVSFAFAEGEIVTIEQLTQHLKKDEVLLTENYKVRVKDKSAASNNEGRTFFGGVLTITMDVWDSNYPDNDGHNTSVRLFGFRDMDPERRHKAQFNGCSCKHGDTLPFFREVFGIHYKMKDIRVEPNSVFSATDNAVMDPRYGLDMEALKLCLEKCQEEDIVQNFNLQVTGGVNFGFTALKGTPLQRTCKPTVQKSGSIQLMLVDAPRRIRLETMRFLIDHCKSAFAPLARLNLTKRTVDKRQKARRLVEQQRLRHQAVQDRHVRSSLDKSSAAGQSSRKDDAGSSAGGRGSVQAFQAPLANLGMSAALGLTGLEANLLTSAGPPPPPPADGANAADGSASGSVAASAAWAGTGAAAPTAAQIQEGMKLIAAAAQSGQFVAVRVRRLSSKFCERESELGARGESVRQDVRIDLRVWVYMCVCQH